MAIERMKLLSITGREENIDKFIVKYLLDSGLQTENAIKVFEKPADNINVRACFVMHGLELWSIFQK